MRCTSLFHTELSSHLVIFLDEFLAVITGCGGEFLFRFNRYDMNRFIIVLRYLC